MNHEHLKPHRHKEGGVWLRGLREAAGLSQRELSKALGLENHGIISQIESGRIRMASDLIARWADAVNHPVRTFAINLMKYNDPAIYEMVFLGEETHNIQIKPCLHAEAWLPDSPNTKNPASQS